MLQVKDLKRNYRLSRDTYEKALRGVSFELKAGEFVAIFGPSGCGKSTLLNALGGLDSGYSGEVLFNGKNLKTLSKGKLAEYRRDNIGFIFQNFNLIPHLSVLENVLAAADLNSDAIGKKKEAAKKALDTVGLGEYVNKKPNQLSGGQRQRVAIARALVNDPDIIIADEPTGAIDTKTAADILQILRDLADSGKLVIVVTHNQEVADFGTRIIRMRDGLVESDEYSTGFQGKESEATIKKSSRLGVLKTFRIAFKNFMQRKGRNILVGLGTSIGIIGIILSMSLGNGITSEINELVTKSSDPREVQALRKDPITGAPMSSGVTKEDFVKLENEIGKENIVSQTEQYVIPFATYEYNGKKTEFGKNHLSNGNKDIAIKNFLTESENIEYGSIQKSDDETGMWLTKSVAQDLAGTSGDEYKSLVGKEVKISILMKIGDTPKEVKYTAKVNGIIKSSAMTLGGTPPLLTYKSMQDLIAKNQLENVVHPYQYSLILKDAKTAENTTKKFEKNNDFMIVSVQSALGTINQIISIIQTILAFVAALSVIVAMVMIGIVLYISVIQRTREIGTLKAIGYKSGSILQIFLFEAAFIAIVANVVAIVIAYGLALVINQVIKSAISINSAILIYPQVLLVIVVISVVAAMLAGLYPAIKASRQDPANALRYE